MKKILLCGIVLLTGSVFAANLGTLPLSGLVALQNEISITANSNSSSLNITGGESNKLVASVSETSNNLGGYNIKMKSTNASKLVHVSDSSKFTTYAISYNGGSAITLTTSDQLVKNVSSLIGLTTSNSNVNVNVVAYPTAPAGTYSDTVTISIVAN